MKLTILRTTTPITQKFNDELVFNAPRPITGNYEWPGDFRHGIYYCSVGPKMTDAWGVIRQILDSDGWLLEYVSPEQVDHWAREFCAKHNVNIDDVDDEKILASFHHNCGLKVFEVNSLEDVLKAYYAPID